MVTIAGILGHGVTWQSWRRHADGSANGHASGSRGAASGPPKSTAFHRNARGSAFALRTLAGVSYMVWQSSASDALSDLAVQPLPGSGDGDGDGVFGGKVTVTVTVGVTVG